MIAYVGLGVLTWLTISDTKLRAGTFVILALFVVKSWTRRKDVLHPEGERDAEQSGELKADADRGV
jgi:hypothetical protein